jgi:glutathione peroxidase
LHRDFSFVIFFKKKKEAKTKASVQLCGENSVNLCGKNATIKNNKMTTLHSFKIKSLEGKTIDFSDYKGKKVLIVNVASECGYTPQYAQLQELSEAKSDEMVVVGFPCNDFGGQEPGSSETIQQFCQVRYGVTFPLTEKVSIKNNPHPIYKWFTSKAENGVKDSQVGWNFCKFLIDEEGNLVNSFPSSTSPLEIL